MLRIKLFMQNFIYFLKAFCLIRILFLDQSEPRSALLLQTWKSLVAYVLQALTSLAHSIKNLFTPAVAAGEKWEPAC